MRSPIYAADGWELCSLELYLQAGMTLEVVTAQEAPVPGLTATIAKGEIRVSLESRGEHFGVWEITLTSELASVVRDRGSILLGITTLLDVHEKLTQAKVRQLIRDHQIALGTAAVMRRRWRWQR